MASVGKKADYVRSESRKGAGNHHCHWTGCAKPVPPAMWGCKTHWFKLPARLRARIWATYRPGQEITKTPSHEYLRVAQEVQDWIASVDRNPKGEDRNGLRAQHESAVPKADAQTPAKPLNSGPSS